MSDFLDGTFGSGLAEENIETWTGVAFLGSLDLFSASRLTMDRFTVIATRELVSEKRPARFIALVDAPAGQRSSTRSSKRHRRCSRVGLHSATSFPQPYC